MLTLALADWKELAAKGGCGDMQIGRQRIIICLGVAPAQTSGRF